MEIFKHINQVINTERSSLTRTKNTFYLEIKSPVKLEFVLRRNNKLSKMRIDFNKQLALKVKLKRLHLMNDKEKLKFLKNLFTSNDALLQTLSKAEREDYQEMFSELEF